VTDPPEVTTLGRLVSRWFPLLAIAFGSLVAAGVAAVGGTSIAIAAAFVIFTGDPLYGFYAPTPRRRR